MHLQRISKLRRFPFASSGEALDRIDLHLASGQGAGLIQRHQIDLSHFLNRGPTSKQNPMPRAPCNRRQNRRWNRQHQGAGTRDDQ